MNREQITTEEFYDIAVKTIVDVEAGDVFIVKDLFRDIDWRHIDHSKRIKLGFMILDYADSDEQNSIEKLSGKEGKTPLGQQKYRKVANITE